MDSYDLKINIKSLDISQDFQKRLKKIQAKFREVKIVDGSMAQDGSQMYDKLTLRQDLTLNIYDDSYFKVITHRRLSLTNLNDIIKISGFECDEVTIQEGNIEANFHKRDRK